jgi:hypothetical protein
MKAQNHTKKPMPKKLLKRREGVNEENLKDASEKPAINGNQLILNCLMPIFKFINNSARANSHT